MRTRCRGSTGVAASRETQTTSRRPGLAQIIRSGIPRSRDDVDFQVLNELHTHAYRDAFHAELMAEMYRLEVSLYAAVLSEGVDAGNFTMTLPVETAASNLVALERHMDCTSWAEHRSTRMTSSAHPAANAEALTGCSLVETTMAR